MQDKNVHEKHRKRMRERYEKHGADAFDLHQLLEMLLFHSLRRTDTNPVSHEMLEKHPDLSFGIGDSYELTDVKGVGVNTANLLRISQDTALAVLMDGLKRKPMIGAFTRMEYMWLWYKNDPSKRAAVLILDHRYRFIECKALNVRSSNMPKSYERAIITELKKHKGAFAVLCHRHMNNSDAPSVEDIYLTGYLKRALADQGYDLLSHYIITDTDCIECPTGLIE